MDEKQEKQEQEKRGRLKEETAYGRKETALGGSDMECQGAVPAGVRAEIRDAAGSEGYQGIGFDVI